MGCALVFSAAWNFFPFVLVDLRGGIIFLWPVRLREVRSDIFSGLASSPSARNNFSCRADRSDTGVLIFCAVFYAVV